MQRLELEAWNGQTDRQIAALLNAPYVYGQGRITMSGTVGPRSTTEAAQTRCAVTCATDVPGESKCRVHDPHEICLCV